MPIKTNKTTIYPNEPNGVILCKPNQEALRKPKEPFVLKKDNLN